MESIRVVQIAARPGLDSPDVEEVAGAFVNVYTTATSQEKALEIASAEIVQAGWIVLSVEDEHLLTHAEAQASPEALPYYEQALLDGVVLVFHSYSHGGEEPDVVH
ncbi:hypothetical protein [Lysobacter sp. F6437]|uniref:hypothetical protein n=1 Tax=Lysobacter sp. F6437 TaxID=3459296 RepID=UPI00403D5A98